MATIHISNTLRLSTLYVTACLAAIFFSGCAIKGFAQLYPHREATLPADRHAIILLVDGMSQASFNAALTQGKLPHIRQLFYDQGTVVDHATTVFPTVSPPGHQALISGLFPGHAGINAITWFDRANRKGRDYLTLKGLNRMGDDILSWHDLGVRPYSDAPPTLFFDLAGQNTVSLYTPVHWGARQAGPVNIISDVFNYSVSRRYERLDVDAMERALKIFRKSDPQDFPRLSLIALEATDAIEHYEGPRAPRELHTLVVIDRFVAELERLLKAKHLADKTVIVLTADHGQHDTEKKLFDIEGRLLAKGFRISRGNRVRQAELYIKPRGVTSGQIYVVNRPARVMFEQDLRQIFLKEEAPKDLLTYLSHLRAIELILYRQDRERMRVQRHDARATIMRLEYAGEFYYSYTVDPGSADPLKLDALGALSGKMLAENEWQKILAETDAPDAIVQLAQLFDDEQAGDIVFTVKKSHNLFHAKKGNHGSLISDDLLVPLMFAGGGIPAGHRIKLARTVDVVPTLYRFLTGSKLSRRTDGRDLFQAAGDEAKRSLREAEDRRSLAQAEAWLLDQPLWLQMPTHQKVRLKSQIAQTVKNHGMARDFLAREQRHLDGELKNLQKLHLELTQAKKTGRARRARQKAARLDWVAEQKQARTQARLKRLDDLQEILGW